MSPSLNKYLSAAIRFSTILLTVFLFVTDALAQDKTIYILPGSRTLRQITVSETTTLITLAGNARVRQGKTFISGDSIVVNQATKVAEVFGNVHINDADTVNTYSNYLRYLGTERIAYLKKNVKLTDGKGTLLTDELEYNLATGIASYKNGGKVLNGKTVLTSADAVYYESTKDVYFKKYVHLTDPNYDIKADSLLFNTLTREARFISPTTIKTKEGAVINTSNGYYNLASGKAEFYDRTALSDSNYFTIADKIAYVEKDGIMQLEGNGKIVDSTNNITVLGGLIYLNKTSKSFLATNKPVMIFYKDGDSTYLAADTLYSGIRKRDLSDSTALNGRNGTDMIGQEFTANPAPQNDTTNATKDTTLSPVDIAAGNQAEPGFDPLPGTDDTLNTKTGFTQLNPKDSAANPSDSTELLSNVVSIDSMSKTTTGPDTIRYFLGFAHVKIFNDSLQAVSDSLYYSTEDSVFKLFKEPVFWNGKSQVTGDTMLLFTKNQKAERLYVYNNSLVVNEQEGTLYNQVAGKNLNAYFLNGEIDYVRVKGAPAKSIYFPLDDDSAYIGMNVSEGDVIDAYFIKKSLQKIKFIKDVDGTLYPMRDVNSNNRYLSGFKWLDARRPKTYLELFE